MTGVVEGVLLTPKEGMSDLTLLEIQFHDCLSKVLLYGFPAEENATTKLIPHHASTSRGK